MNVVILITLYNYHIISFLNEMNNMFNFYKNTGGAKLKTVLKVAHSVEDNKVLSLKVIKRVKSDKSETDEEEESMGSDS